MTQPRGLGIFTVQVKSDLSHATSHLASDLPSSAHERRPCPVCGLELFNDASSCATCGYEVAKNESARDAHKCSRCGAEVLANTDFCAVCGLKLQSRYPRPRTLQLGIHQRKETYVDHSVVASTQVIHIPELVVAKKQAFITPWSLVAVQHDGSEGQSFAVSEQGLTIGRKRGKIRFDEDPFLAPLHAHIEVYGNHLKIVDLGSENGIYLRIRNKIQVYRGDRFLLGNQLLGLDNIPENTREHMSTGDEERIFGTVLTSAAWACLTLLGIDGSELDRYFLRTSPIVLGRSESHINFPQDLFMSHRHAQLTMQTHDDRIQIELEDLQSANGTYLRIREDCIVSEGDMFRMGDQLFRVKVG